jgi:PAS domain S-box-containing protein
MMSVLDWLFGAAGEVPRGYCLNWRPDLVALHATSDTIMAMSYFALPLGILWLLRHRLSVMRERRAIAWMIAAVVLLCGLDHLLEVIGIWSPIYGLQGVAKAVTAIASGVTVALLWPMLPMLVRLPSPRALADANERLRREVAAHESTLRELEAARRELESRVIERTRELSLVKARFETALRGAKVYVFSQDAELRYSWIYSPHGDAAEMLGRTDEDILTSPEHEAVIDAKRRVLDTGTPEDCEVSFIMPQSRALFALHIDPTFGADRAIDGIMCAAIDISRIRSLESEQRRLTEELGTALQRYETALHGSNVTVYTQDRDLRYTSVSGPMLGLDVDEIVGQTDDDILPEESREAIVALKREVLLAGQPRDSEARIERGSTVRWYDFHIEPLRDVTGEIVGLTCAAVDITERKEGEAHLRLLMRELTHRSKNLLAVIQAMARQTGRHAGTIEAFLEQFSARLQALAASHDLLIQESWYGALLTELVRTQLGHYLDREGSQVTAEGPAILLKPEAAQSLGLALHELSTNAAKFGALSVPTGRVTIAWRRLPPTEGFGAEIIWTESGGPPVRKPERQGFGSLVIERNLARSLDADVELTFPPEGVCCRIIIPLTQFAASR